MPCNHKFINIGEVTKMAENQFRSIHGARAGCIECGEIREVYEDGQLKIIYDPRPNNRPGNTAEGSSAS